MDTIEKIMELENRIKKLESLLFNKGDTNEIVIEPKRNRVGPYNLKIVYPGIFRMLDNPSAGFPKNKKPLAEQMTIGSLVFIYVTSPYKKIIGICEPTENMKEVENDRWPYNVPLRWVITPRSPGVSLKEVGLDIRPRPGDTNFELTEDEANRIKALLEEQEELNDSNEDRLL